MHVGKIIAKHISSPTLRLRNGRDAQRCVLERRNSPD